MGRGYCTSFFCDLNNIFGITTQEAKQNPPHFTDFRPRFTPYACFTDLYAGKTKESAISSLKLDRRNTEKCLGSFYSGVAGGTFEVALANDAFWRNRVTASSTRTSHILMDFGIALRILNCQTARSRCGCREESPLSGFCLKHEAQPTCLALFGLPDALQSVLSPYQKYGEDACERKEQGTHCDRC